MKSPFSSKVHKPKPHIAHPESCEGGFVNDDNENDGDDDANDDW